MGDYGAATLDRLPPLPQTKKFLQNAYSRSAGVRFEFTEKSDASQEGTVSSFNGVIAAVNVHAPRMSREVVEDKVQEVPM